MKNMFLNCSIFNGHIENWNVSNIEDMSGLFYQALNFNQPLNNWDVSNVKDMSFMFNSAEEFDQEIGNWDVSNVLNMHSMFRGAASFNQPLNNWNVGKVIDMGAMFMGAISFNQSLNNWNVGNVIDMGAMFFDAHSFNGSIGEWNVSNVEEMSLMFGYAENFNQSIGGWNVYNVKSMNQMFLYADSFNHPIGDWDVSNLVNAIYMFAFAESFNQSLKNWEVSSIYYPSGMFYNATSFDQNLANWKFNSDIDPNTSLSLFFSESGMSCENYDLTLKGWATNSDLPEDVIFGAEGLKYWASTQSRNNLIYKNGWTIIGDEFYICNYGDDEVSFITIWQTDNPGSTEDNQILIPATGSGYIIQWEEVGNPMNSGMETGQDETIITFPHSGQYRLRLSGNLQRIEFNNQGDRLKLISIDQWGATPWQSMENAFFGCANMEYFAEDIPDLSKVENMNAMFRGCSNFNGEIGEWDVSNVHFMNSVFQGALIFDGDISAWDVSNAERMTMMFSGARDFNQDIGNWDVENVQFMNLMFSNASSFDQNLGNWLVRGNLSGMLNNSGLSCENYDLTLIGWADSPNTPDNRTLGAIGLNYWLAADARAILVNEKGWTISGDAFANCDYKDCDLPPTTINIQGQYPTCSGEVITLRADANGVNYSWFKNGELIIGENSQSLIVTEAGFYSVIYTDNQNCESEESDALEITFLDATDPPILLNAGDAVLRSTRPNCRGYAFWEAEILTCGDINEIEKRSLWRLDLFNTGQFDILSTQPRPDGSARNNLRIEEELLLGIHRLVWEIRDEHGNLLIEEQLITLVDMNPPNPVCMHGISTNLSRNTGAVTIPARVFDVGSWDDCTDKEDLIFTFSSDLSHTHHTWTCDDLDGEEEITFTVEIWVTNQYGHQNRCFTYLKVQDNRDACPQSGSVAPLVYKPTEELQPADFTELFPEEDPRSSAFLLHNNHPNPFTSHTSISFDLPQPGTVQLSIYNPYGGQVYHQSRHFDAGSQSWLIEGGELPHSGFYIYRVGVEGESFVGRMLRVEF